MGDHTKRWLVARVLIVAVNVGVIGSIPVEHSNIDWAACFLISFISAAALFAWLRAIRSRQNVDWSRPYSWRQPFWPMAWYPVRYWFLASWALVIAGATAMAKGIVFHQGHEAVPGTFVFMGLFMMVALRTWIRKFSPVL
jgi:hypothetical protein